eukprot:jgi/Tetstr1/459171/TSEL_004617.t1
MNDDSYAYRNKSAETEEDIRVAAMSVRANEARMLNNAIFAMRMATSDLPLARTDTPSTGAPADLAIGPAEGVGTLS